ncbi:MAG TPA: DUF2207 domain-containing protein [Xanthomonadales bacterium]|nr:DUF2207 domain-containing protein [Xanthomonadales bacterium]
MSRLALYLICIGCMLLPAPCLADERILNYHSDLLIHPDGELTVTEEIRVRAEGNAIRRGIYRDFPTRYRDRLGNHYTVGFSVEAVLRDDVPESWHSEELSNGIRVYAGSVDHLLQPGIYAYTFRFRTNRQLGFFAGHDELYWNVTGNGWDFPIDRATVRISLPFSVPAGDLELSGYSGVSGSTESSLRSGIIDDRMVEFEATQPLAAREGLTVVVAWPKGLIAAPTARQKVLWFSSDNSAAIVLLLGALLTFFWYYGSWRKVGRDPGKGIVIPLFKPPAGLSPAACRYVLDMSLGSNAFSAAIISLAVKGHIRIEETGKKFTLRRIPGGGKAEPTRGETGVLQSLLPHSPSSIALTDTNHARFQQARSALNHALKKEYRGRLFKLNTRYTVPPLIITILSGVLALGFNGSPAIWITWLILVAVLHGLFTWLLRAPTAPGRQVMDEIEGFRMYLDTAEQDRLDRMRSPALTPEVFESFLPYAYALGVENHWCERFARELPKLEPGHQTIYQPAWYSGRYQGMSALNHLSDSFSGSFTSAISSASSPPGSSSGSSGGGSSGGGGGGGGGGGW